MDTLKHHFNQVFSTFLAVSSCAPLRIQEKVGAAESSVLGNGRRDLYTELTAAINCGFTQIDENAIFEQCRVLTLVHKYKGWKRPRRDGEEDEEEEEGGRRK